MSWNNQPIFALDIGTRSVIGLLLEPYDKGLKVLHSEVIEHQSRAMMDGQIHCVDDVAHTVLQLKARLEAKFGSALRGVSVAAAGRALKTVKVGVTEQVNGEELTREHVLALELEAVQKAQRELVEQQEFEGEYHCVGYSVVQYTLNSNKIAQLVGQRGKAIGLELIVTFLPREVVDSLFAVLHRVGLEMTSLTLEPIAASEVVIPQNMRQLSLALVDVGAGTSDIAVSADGGIVGYEMVPQAGDSITEAIGETYLLDFNEAERVKRLLDQTDKIKFIDVLGFEHELDRSEIIAAIEPQVRQLASKISDKIKALAIKPIQAVICIGGGSMTPGFSGILAEELGLGHNRVAVRGREVVTEVLGEIQSIDGPEAITPLGIGVNTFKGNGLSFAKVLVNDREVRMFQIHQGSVADALLSAGIDSRKLFGKPGMALSFTVNGKLEIVKGSMGTPAKILVNGTEAKLQDRIKNNDHITLVDPIQGENASLSVGELSKRFELKKVGINEDEIYIKPTIVMNKQIVGENTFVEDLAEIEVLYPRTVEEVLAYANKSIDWQTKVLYVNGAQGQPETEVEDGDLIEIEILNVKLETATCFEDEPKTVVNKEVVNHYGSGIKVKVNGQELVIDKDSGQVMFIDIFNYINFSNRPPEPGCTLIMKVNNMPASFTSMINSGDAIEIKWENI